MHFIAIKYFKVQITVFRSDTADGEYTEYLKFSAIGVCNFMKTVFKKYIYSSMKDCANLPDPDTCPVTKVTLTSLYFLRSTAFGA